MRTDMAEAFGCFVIASEAKESRSDEARLDCFVASAPRKDAQDLSRKYGSTGPCSLMVSGLPWRSFAAPAGTRIQLSLTQYSSTLVFSAPLKRMPTSRAR